MSRKISGTTKCATLISPVYEMSVPVQQQLADLTSASCALNLICSLQSRVNPHVALQRAIVFQVKLKSTQLMLSAAK